MTRSIVLLDGGMGQELIKRSSKPPSPLWSSQVMMDEPHIVEAVHREYVDAGAKVITLNAYTATPERLKRDADISLFEPMQERAIELANAARKGRSDVALAGCLPPLVGSYRPDIVPEFDKMRETYEQITHLQAPFVDCLICETLSSVKEVEAAVAAARKGKKPVWISMSVTDEDGTKLRSGEALEAGVQAAIDGGADAVLVNCSWPEAVGQSMSLLAQSGLPFGGYANGFTGIDALKPGGTVSNLEARSDLGPQAYGDHALNWIEAGASIVGGCCEVGPAHIAELSRQIQNAGYEIAFQPNGVMD